MKIIPVILSGGSGTRLWPLSRSAFPKQFLPLASSGATLIQETAQRIKDTKLFLPPIIICSSEHKFIIAEQLRQIGILSPTIILEPAGRNTAPALTIAALCIRAKYGKDALMLAMPSDHIIQSPTKFLSTVKHSISQVGNGSLMTFGIKPSHPETAYGYIQQGKIIDKQHRICEIARFVEKPDAKRAKTYLSSGKYLWNSGIFLFAVSSYLDEIKHFAPDIIKLCTESLAGKRKDLDFILLGEEPFMALPSVSIDNAVMECTKKGVVIPMDCGWGDLGSWDALWDIHAKDPQGNAIIGQAHIIDSKNSYVRSDGPVISLLGVENLVVISTKDAVLVADKDKVQKIKGLVEKIKKDDPGLVENQQRVYRPWGYYESVDEGDRYQVKHLSIKPKEKLSVQMHHHRTEHWIVVRGTAKVMLNDKESVLSENQSFYIPVGAKHSLENPGKINLDIIEVQTGSYLEEDDIIRFEDRYNRR